VKWTAKSKTHPANQRRVGSEQRVKPGSVLEITPPHRVAATATARTSAGWHEGIHLWTKNSFETLE